MDGKNREQCHRVLKNIFQFPGPKHNVAKLLVYNKFIYCIS